MKRDELTSQTQRAEYQEKSFRLGRGYVQHTALDARVSFEICDLEGGIALKASKFPDDIKCGGVGKT